MKNIKKFLLNIMNINEAKRKIEECLSKYPVDSEDDVFSKEDLILLISQMNTKDTLETAIQKWLEKIMNQVKSES